MNRINISENKEPDISEYIKKAEEKKALLTVFVLSSNRCVYLKPAIQSILDQSFKDFVLVVLDNHSKDGTKEMVSTFEDDRVVFISRESKPGDWNFQYAMEIANTKYYAAIHDDDIYEPEYLKMCIDELENNGYYIVSVRNKRIDGKGNITGESAKKGKKTVWQGDEYFRSYFSPEIDGIMFPSIIYRTEFIKKNTEVLKEVFIDHPIPASDTLFLFEAGKLGASMCKLDDQLLLYRIHDEQDSNINDGLLYLQLFDAVLDNEHFSKILNDRTDVLIKRINDSYYRMMKNYYRHRIDKAKFKSFFGHNCVEYIKKTAEGRKLVRYLKFRYRFIDSLYLFPKYKT